ncbi:hypothetical protein R1flu_013006 [Riccia fluitans]|uniref:DUF3099 domain-containing protein n=1 Tax=Riccia fluitans TaxID=41844 RepID=A0ABD1ZC85_9MARC
MEHSEVKAELAANGHDDPGGSSRVYEEPLNRGRQFIYAFARSLVVLSIVVAFVYASRLCVIIAPVVVIAIVKENRSNDSGIG